MSATFSGSGSNSDKLEQSDVYMAIIGASFIKDERCMNEARSAAKLKKPMFGLVQLGTDLSEEIKLMPWKKMEFYDGAKNIGEAVKKIMVEIDDFRRKK